ncbi:ATP-binding protein [Sphingomonas sp. HT-1]|uniref:hybrid sensor histidine kinase/response regulator n=1 Tax=unclassified Sphingomonas TaxID=196159 RepID=UPI0002F01ACC|nr:MULTISPECIES: ATP-binding protein [unclassified Sphingomonas]KTF69660.1 hybrid sensor histidine kinase/response regulator [Sphingomonas sp. WG]
MQRSLILMGLTGLLPIVLLGAVYTAVSLREQRNALDRQAVIASRSTARLVGREIAANLDAVKMIGRSPTLDRPLDLDRFTRLGMRLMEDHPNWSRISVADAGGNRVLDLPEPIGGRLGKVVEPESLAAAVRTGQPQVGIVAAGPGGGKAFAIRAPAARASGVRYVVSAVLRVEAMRPLLVNEDVPPSWRVRLFDRRGTLVAQAGKAPAGPVHAVRTRVPELGGGEVRVEVPGGTFAALTRQARMVLIAGGIVALLLFAALALLLARELRRFRQREAAAVQAQRLEALGRLTGGVAHDLNNLLTPVLGGLDLLRGRCAEDAKAMRYIDSATQSAERARGLVARLLAYSRRQALTPEAIDVPAMLHELHELLQRSVGPSIGCTIAAVPPLPPISADRHQLELAILNLVINARDAIQAGDRPGGRIAIQARAARRDEARGLPRGDYLAIAVADDGCGMDAVTLRRAVEPFFTTKASDRGTGLGLSMVHGFAEQSAGRLLIESAPGEGTTVTLVLPATADAVAETRIQQARPTRTTRILLVDDDPAVREAAAEVLRTHGHAVAEADSLVQGMAALLQDAAIGVVITDYMMPGGTGGAFITRARAAGLRQPFLVLTGYMDSTEDLPAGVPQLRKPFRERELLHAVDALLG